MDHIYPGVIEPIQDVIQGLIALPKKCRPHPFHAKASEDLLSLTEKEEHLRAMQRALAEKSEALSKKEEELSRRAETGRIAMLPPGCILPAPTAPRRTQDDHALLALAESIRCHGILQPLTVRRLHETVTDHGEVRYELISGDRRLRAACAVGCDAVPCIVLDADNRRAAELALIENLQHESLDMFEEAGAIAALIDLHAMTQEEIAKSLSRSQSAIANKLRILRLTQTERTLILDGGLSERHARTFLKLKDLSLRTAAIRHTVRHHLTVAETEDYIDGVLFAEERRIPDPNGVERPAAAITDAPLPHRPQNPIGKPVIKDLGLFFNTVDRALALLAAAGIRASEERSESDGETVLRISIAHD